MRLKEPFQGYKLSSGHFMFHMAYLAGSYYAVHYVIDDPKVFDDESYRILMALNVAHIVVPLCNLLSMICASYGFHVLEKTLDILSIF